MAATLHKIQLLPLYPFSNPLYSLLCFVFFVRLSCLKLSLSSPPAVLYFLLIAASLSIWFNTQGFIGMSVTLVVPPKRPANIFCSFCRSSFCSYNGSVFLSAALPLLSPFRIWHSTRRLSSCNTCSTMLLDLLWANTSQGELCARVCGFVRACLTLLSVEL